MEWRIFNMTAERREGELQPREGIRFSASIVGNNVILYVERQNHPIHTYKLTVQDGIGDQTIDAAFQDLVSKGDFSNVADEELRETLKVYADEKSHGVNFALKTFRFLRARENERITMPGNPKLTFILTADKSDIREMAEQQANIVGERATLLVKAIYGEVEEQPLTEEEKRFIEELKDTDVIHIFMRGANNPAWGVFDNKVIQSKDGYYSPTQNGLSGDKFLALLARIGISKDQIHALFSSLPEDFDVIRWSALGVPGSEWPSLKDDALAELAHILGKRGAQRYVWDGGYGDVSESWKAAFIKSDGTIVRNQ